MSHKITQILKARSDCIIRRANLLQVKELANKEFELEDRRLNLINDMLNDDLSALTTDYKIDIALKQLIEIVREQAVLSEQAKSISLNF